MHSYVEQYSSASSRQDKSDILSTIVTEVRMASPEGGFIKQETKNGRWFEVGDFLAREKVSQAFRDALHESYRSSKKYKHEKRRQRDRAAKIAKQKGVAVDTTKKVSSSTSEPKKKAAGSVSAPAESPFKKTGVPTVMRGEDTMDNTATYNPAVIARQQQGNNTSPSMATSASVMAAAGQSAAMPPLFPQHHRASLPNNSSDFNGQFQFEGGSNYSGMGMTGGQRQQQQRTSWPHVTHNIFHPIHTAAGMMYQPQNRRFSDAPNAMMMANAMAPQFHNSEPNINWSAHMDMDSNGMMHQESAASLHNSFPTGMTMMQQQQMMANNFQGNMMMMQHMAPFDEGQFSRNSTAHTTTTSVDDEHHSYDNTNTMDESSHHNRPQRRSRNPVEPPAPLAAAARARSQQALARSGSNVSAASASAIVARLESSLPDVYNQEDENPFEPVPLPHENEDDHEGQNEEEQKDDESMLLNWWILRCGDNYYQLNYYCEQKNKKLNYIYI